jgi:hypothetical protein
VQFSTATNEWFPAGVDSVRQSGNLASVYRYPR